MLSSDSRDQTREGQPCSPPEIEGHLCYADGLKTGCFSLPTWKRLLLQQLPQVTPPTQFEQTAKHDEFLKATSQTIDYCLFIDLSCAVTLTV
jgi:hypothetical protein